MRFTQPAFASGSKETAIFLLPAMLLLAFQERRAHHGLFAVKSWLPLMAMVTSWYLLYATLKGQLLPVSLSARLFDNTQPHVSLIETLLWQIKRDGAGMFNLDNQFWHFMREDWLVRDPLLIIAGAIAVAINLLRGIRPAIPADNFSARWTRTLNWRQTLPLCDLYRRRCTAVCRRCAEDRPFRAAIADRIAGRCRPRGRRSRDQDGVFRRRWRM
jgi:hypothetical protein